MKAFPYILTATFLLHLLTGCQNANPESEILTSFQAYYEASKAGSDARWNYTADTVRLWFDEKDDSPILRIKGAETAGPWQAWDEAMNATYWHDSLWYDQAEHAVKGYFNEHNDFYKLIGKGPTKTLQTYWLNDQDKIKEILIYWIPEANTTTSEHLQPVVEWAMQYDSVEIQALYPEGKLVPSEENAKRWKALLEKYHEVHQSSGN